jgi:hypothetical protein
MIGFIAGAGIVVRKSIILVDFIELRLKQGMTLADAVVDAGAVRFRPMMLTAAAVIVGSAVILFDPIFQGLAISLMAGEVASLFLSRMTVPVLFYMSKRKKHAASVVDFIPSPISANADQSLLDEQPLLYEAASSVAEHLPDSIVEQEKPPTVIDKASVGESVESIDGAVSAEVEIAQAK